MQHLDDGVLNALLDGELTGTDLEAADRHLRECAPCRDRLSEARAFMAEADGLVSAVEMPPARARSGGAATPPGTLAERPRRVDYRALAWAATVVLALALGYVGGARMHMPDTSGAVRQANRETDTMVPPAAAEIATGQPARNAAEAPKELAGTPPARPGASPAPARSDAGDTQAGGAAAQPGAPPPAGALALKSAAPGESAEPTANDRSDEVTSLNGLRDQATVRGNAFAAAPRATPAAPPASTDQAPAALSRRLESPGFRPIGWDSAIAVLDGTVRLIDGLAPLDVAVGPGDGLGAGFETGTPVVRIRYLLAGQDTVDLLEQRVVAVRQERKTSGDSALVPATRDLPGGGTEVRWRGSGGFLLALRSALTPGELAALLARVR